MRPAAGVRRRSFVFVALAAALALGSSCAEEPVALNPAGVRVAAQRAIGRCRGPEPDRARRISSLLAEAERASAEDAAAPFWRRDPQPAAAAWERVAIAAHEATIAVRRREDEARERWRDLTPLVAEEVARANESLERGGGLGIREGAASTRAAYHWELAQRLEREGQLERAVAAAEEALDLASVVDKSWENVEARFRDPGLLKQWRAWVRSAIAESKRDGEPVIIVDKLRGALHIYDDGKRVASYSAELGANGLKPKRYAGDKATPEGRYRVVEARGPGATQFHKALLLDYPNKEDVTRFRAGQRRGSIPRRAGIGGLIEIHGHGGDGKDWTDGCVALANADMDKVFARSRVGTPVTIVGTH